MDGCTWRYAVNDRAGQKRNVWTGSDQRATVSRRVIPTLEITGQDFLPGSLVGNTAGELLPMAGKIFVDTNRTLSGPGNYVDVEMFGASSNARFVAYPHNGVGTIEDLGDGWYRHHLANFSHWGNSGFVAVGPPTAIRLAWKFNFDASTVPIVFDNFTIVATNVPEPSSLAVCIIGCLVWDLSAPIRRRKTGHVFSQR